jgi:hypothetical protein
MSLPSTTPRVLNKYKKLPCEEGVYIGRPSKWGNPSVMGRGVTRDQACDYFEKFVEDNPEFKQAIKDELKGKNVICFCAPHRCHGDTLVRIANE